jgi:cytochrome P450
MDGKRHRNYRKLVQPSFVPGRAVWWLDNWIRETVGQLVEAFEGADRADLNTEFCAPIPLLTITGSFGITIEEALDVRAAVTSDGQDVGVLAKLLIPIISARRTEPTDDLISVLVAAEVTDEDGQVHRLTDEEVLAFAFLLLAAGSGTTWKQMGITIIALLRHPEALAAVKQDRALLRGVVEESLRWTPTDPVFARFAVKDTELGGVRIPEGAVVHACLAAANRDPARWERPDEFDPVRTPASVRTLPGPKSRTASRRCSTDSPICDWTRTRRNRNSSGSTSGDRTPCRSSSEGAWRHDRSGRGPPTVRRRPVDRGCRRAGRGRGAVLG